MRGHSSNAGMAQHSSTRAGCVATTPKAAVRAGEGLELPAKHSKLLINMQTCLV